ncbi:MAG: hypothetical protein R3C59_11425 [Planctomycetaceae bacterium]
MKKFCRQRANAPDFVEMSTLFCRPIVPSIRWRNRKMGGRSPDLTGFAVNTPRTVQNTPV